MFEEEADMIRFFFSVRKVTLAARKRLGKIWIEGKQS